MNRPARFMCHECGGELRAIREGAMRDPTFTLECGHRRSRKVPPLKPGRVSIENLDTAAGRAMFPVVMEVI